MSRLRKLPRLTYSGLSIVMSNPSRFDITANDLLVASGGTLFNNFCLRPEHNILQCDVRVMEDKSPWLDGTKCVLLLGEAAMHEFVPSTKGNTINEMRGSPLEVNGIPAIASYFPQDAADPKAFERTLNELSKDHESNVADSSEEAEDVKRFSNTSKKNYAWWLKSDTKKCIAVLKNNGKWPDKGYPNPIYHTYPSCDEVVNVLQSNEDKWMDFDTETDYQPLPNLLCFSFSFDGVNIYNVPVLNNNYQWAYSGLHFIMRALTVAIKRNILVAHNGAAFDFPLLTAKYRIPVYRVWDTMIAMHRCFPDLEKSLGHCVAYWLWEKFHKDNNPESYRTHDDMMNKLRYCGQDVYTMSWIRKKIQDYAKRIPGLPESIDCAMRSIRPYLITSLLGIPYSETKRQAIIKENDALMMQYLRMIHLLIGETSMKEVRSVVKSKHPGAFPSSNPQCCKYFHDMLGYAVVNRGLPSKKTGIRNPSLAKRSMYKLRLKYENPVIDLCNAYRYTKLEVTTPLGFLPWKDDNNKIIPPINPET